MANIVPIKPTRPVNVPLINAEILVSRSFRVTDDAIAQAKQILAIGTMYLVRTADENAETPADTESESAASPAPPPRSITEELTPANVRIKEFILSA